MFNIINYDQRGGECSMHGKGEKCIQNISRKTWGKETTWKT